MHKKPVATSRCEPCFVAYYRVSTKRQGRSGLGIDAQRRAVADYAQGASGRVLAEFTECESGRRTDRAELASALAACRLRNATLLVAKLDRLARNAAFLLSLRDAGVDFVACDLPGMNRMTIGIMAVIAEEEARMISERTRAALSAAKRRGVRLGTPRNLTPRARKLGNRASAEVRSQRAAERAADLAPIVLDLQRQGIQSLRALARGLDALGLRTSRGAPFTPAAVRRVLLRLK